jgi:hypothetical protein
MDTTENVGAHETTTGKEGNGGHSPARAKPETKMIRIPLALFVNKQYLAMLPESIQKKAEKAGIKLAGERKWGPEVPVTAKEAGELFKVSEGIYRSRDTSIPKNIKTFGYQLRATVADEFGIQIENVRTYVRKPKPKAEPVQAAPAQPEMHMAASMPPRANLDRATDILSSVVSILKDNGQSGVAALVDQATGLIAVPETENA